MKKSRKRKRRKMKNRKAMVEECCQYLKRKRQYVQLF